MAEKNHSYKLSFAVYGLITSILITLLGLLGAFEGLKSILISTTSEIRHTILILNNDISTIFGSIWKIEEIVSNSDNISKYNLELESKIIELNIENNILKSQINQNINNPMPSTYARVIYISDDRSKIMIDKGSHHSIKQDDIVVLGKYLIGSVVEVHAGYSIVDTIRNSQIIIPVQFLETEYKGVLSFSVQDGKYKITEIPRSFEYKKDLEVITLGINSNIPYGYLIGKVGNNLSKSTDISNSVEVIYPIDILNLEEIFVISINR